ncbi:MAG: N-acetylmuramoyl-L-alanine amidase [Clostridiales bacterium]|nr:N-acetylmuramoyl-L-alanine amidase [Clostridiales bacterium]
MNEKEFLEWYKQEVCKLGYVDRGINKGNLYVVKNTNAPAILIECGFI